MVIAKPGLDGHDRGAKIIARALRDAGMEVIYTGLHQTPEQIVETAIQEDADAVGLSILSGAHMTLVPKIVEGLRAREADDVLVLVGGTIPDDDAEELKAAGVAAVFTPGAPTSEIVDFLRAARRVARSGCLARRAATPPRQPSWMWSTESEPGEPIVTSTVGFAGRVTTTRGTTARLVSARRVGATICAATDRSRSASGGTSELHRAGRDARPRTARPDPDARHRRARACPAPADSGIPRRPIVTAFAGFAGSGKSSFVAEFRNGNGSTAAPSFGCTSKWRW